MVKNKIKNVKVKMCPFLRTECSTKGCGIYDEKLHRCEIGLLAYNLYILTQAMRDFQVPETPEVEVPVPDAGAQETIQDMLKL